MSAPYLPLQVSMHAETEDLKFGNEFIIIGAGPVGLAAACLLAKQGFDVKVFEGRKDIPNNLEESYPIGINPRAIHCLEMIDPDLKKSALQESRLVNAWQIFGGSRMVADLRSETVYGTTRGSVNLFLYQYAACCKNITIHFGHKLRDIHFDTREVEFDVDDGTGVTRPIRVPAATSRILAADGVYSRVRRAMETQPDSFCSMVVPWRSEFRVLFAKPGATSPELDPSVHYIFNGCYAAIVKSGSEETWTCVLGAKDTAPAQERSLLLSRDASAANVAALRRFLDARCPRMSPLLTDEELQRYFSRRSYRGAVVRVSRLHHGEWVALLGDAAHSVLPPTGEGINSGMEDCVVLAGIMAAGRAAPFEEYNRVRLPDLHGLLDIAGWARLAGAEASRQAAPQGLDGRAAPAAIRRR